MNKLRWAAAFAMSAMISPALSDKAENHLQKCSGQQFCEVSRREFIKWFPLAEKGDYQGMRNVSFCLADGCDGAVEVDRGLGCAWRLAIINSGDPRADNTDINFFDAYCRPRMTSFERDVAYGHSREIFKRVYKRNPPANMGGAALEPPRR